MTIEPTQRKIVVRTFGGVENLESECVAPLSAGPGEVVIDLTSIGMNQADLMARRGEYRLSSGEPPFTPGIEGGGMVSAVGAGVTDRAVGQRVILTLGAPARKGTYCSQFVVRVSETVPVPDGVPDCGRRLSAAHSQNFSASAGTAGTAGNGSCSAHWKVYS